MRLCALLLPLGLLCAALAAGHRCGLDERSLRARRDTRRPRPSSAPRDGCATSLARGRRSTGGLEHRHSHRRPRPPRGAPEQRALYFNGHGGQLRLRAGYELPRDSFTLQVWLRPDGGQRSPAVIAGLYDKCSYASRDRGWVLGIQTVSDLGARDPRYFFSLKTDRARKVTTITAHRSYLPNQWVHLTATYDQRLLKLYVNGAQVGTSGEQVGGIYSFLTRKCKVLMVGGNVQNQNFRGYIEHLRLWRTARTQKEILFDMGQTKIRLDTLLPQLVLQDSFENVTNSWSPMKNGTLPEMEFIYHHGFLLDTSLNLPPCGQTVCDNVDVIRSYNKFPSFRQQKVVRYRVVNIFDDNKQDPMVSKEQVEIQHHHLMEAFSKYNITWELEVLEVKNTSLRKRLILANCDISKVGDEICDRECNHSLTGYDGGDCRGLYARNYLKKKHNGVCDMDCNNEKYFFDGGDCCNPDITDVTKTCFNPASPHRAYLDVNELKTILKLDGSTHLNIFFANSSEEELAGVATWPWDKEALTHLGGIVLNPSFYGIPGHTHTMIHEIGHSLGLYHVFRGISEIMSCSDPCMETEPSFETGDLCGDTNPAPKHKMCGDPSPGNETCGYQHFVNTPFNNYMSYADDDCTNSFTPNQVARMHCYLDLVYHSWQPTKAPSLVALAPQVVGHTSTSVTMEWFPPIDGRFFEREVGSTCDLCLEGRVLVQYAINASSPLPCNPSGHWSPREAEGHPDVEQPCKSSVRTWSPNNAVVERKVPPICPEPQGCHLELEFQYPLIPEYLTIWVTLITADLDSTGAVNDIRLVTVSGKHISLGPQDVFCDIPLTIKIDLKSITEEVSSVQIYTLDESLEIDAAMLISVPDSPLCASCHPVSYRIVRDPPFSVDEAASFSDLNRRFTDTNVIHGSTYTYQVITVSAGEESIPSPPLTYVHGGGYCGDGIIQRDLAEECDDMNKINGDGCSFFCQQELSFNCIDEPSRCYFHDGDGVCEDFERMTSIKDCGVYTPQGYMDQWASNVSVSHPGYHLCPASVVIGQPAASEVCRTKVTDLNDGVAQNAWFPCTVPAHVNQGHFWLKTYFSRPMVAAAVIIHLVSDGTYYNDQQQETIRVQLFDTKDQSHDLGVHILSCRNNPMVIPVIHDLSHPFYHSKAVLISFTSPLVAISGVGLRSFHNFDPITMGSCQRGETYSRAEQSCVQYSCEATECQELQIENAVMNLNSSGRINGGQCVITCKLGYVLQIHRDDDLIKSQPGSSVTITCMDGKWNKQVTCEPVDCGIPDQYHVYPATFSCPLGTTFNKQCFFQCQPPAQLRGNINVLTCMEDGLWSFPEALCDLRCPAPPMVPNAVLQTGRCRADGHKVGAFCKYKCLLGYYVSDPLKKTRKKAFKTQCMEDGSWQEGSCVPITCSPPPSKFHGLYQCTNEFRFKSECRIKCEDSKSGPHNNVIQCRKDGTWSGSFQLCATMSGECDPPNGLNSNLRIHCSEGFEIGAECTLSCVVPNRDSVMLPLNMTERDLQYWMDPPRIKKIVCTAERKWYPHPQTIHCIKGCEQFMSDYYCDGMNNRAFCNYDGGDCCASTVKTKKVTPFPMNCDIQGECACLDPNARENSRKDSSHFNLG
ncbi:pappalysin-1 isoform X1 [Lissotriton helveticus]